MRYLIVIAVFLSLISCQAKKNTANTGWDNLLENNNLSKWHVYGKDNIGKAWKLENGILSFTAKEMSKSDRGNLATNEEYENFHLKLEWKISPKGNSGIMFLVNEDLSNYKLPYLTGPEMQILDNDGHKDGKIFNHRAGDLYDLIPVNKETVKPVGQWNKAEIILKNAQLDFFLNGQKVVSTTMWDKNWDQMVAKSKFSKMPGFAKYKKGKIVLQDHEDDVWFRNIMIKKL